MRTHAVLAIALTACVACPACSPAGTKSSRNETTSIDEAPSLPSALVPPVTMDDSRWLEGLWLGCHAIIPEYDAAWADHRLDEDDLKLVAAAVAREHAADPEGKTCRYTRSVPPVMARSRTRRLPELIGFE